MVLTDLRKLGKCSIEQNFTHEKPKNIKYIMLLLAIYKVHKLVKRIDRSQYMCDLRHHVINLYLIIQL